MCSWIPMRSRRTRSNGTWMRRTILFMGSKRVVFFMGVTDVSVGGVVSDRAPDSREVAGGEDRDTWGFGFLPGRADGVVRGGRGCGLRVWTGKECPVERSDRGRA